jgi:hypothetical protein
MKLISKAALGGLLWLSFSSTAMFGDTLSLYQTYNINASPVNGGGQFMGTLDGTDPVTVYCIDFANDLSSPQTVDVSTLANISDTRYGNTSPSNFTFFDGTMASDSLYTGTGANALTTTQLTLTAEQRYLLAAYLVTQYQLVLPPTTAILNMNDGLQGAIWDLLNTSNTTFTANNESTYLTQAIEWLKNPADTAAIAALTSEVTIYTPVSLSGRGDSQEMLGLTSTSTPEPQTLAMLGIGLLALGMFRKTRKA